MHKLPLRSFVIILLKDKRNKPLNILRNYLLMLSLIITYSIREKKTKQKQKG